MGAEDVLYRLDPRKIHVVSGDIPAGYWELHSCVMERSGDLFKEAGKDQADKLNLDQAIAGIEIKNIENANKTANLVGVGVGALAGLRFFGPIGAIGGAVAAQVLVGNRHEVTVDVRLLDGRHFIANMDKKVYKRLQAISGRIMDAEVEK